MITTLFLVTPVLSRAGAFDPIPTGAQAWGMGNAYTAVVNDANAVQWNPAALADVIRPQAVGSHMDIQSLGLLFYDQFTYAQPFVFNNVIGVSWLRMGTSGQVSFLNYSENTFILSYQQPIIENLSAGLNVKVFEVESDNSAGGLGFDLGLRYRVLPELGVAVVGENINHPEIFWLTSAVDRLPVNLRVGLAGYIDPDTTVAVDGHHLVETYPEFHVGVERWFFDHVLALRAGGTYLSQNKKMMPALGFGVKFTFIQFDYAYGFHYELDGNHVFSLKISF